jgi:hypothetical protein
MLITFAELAKLKNVSRAAVTKKKKTGVLDAAIVNHNGRDLVNKEMAMDLWNKNTDPGRGVVTIPTPTKKELKKKVDALPDDAIPDYNVSRARKEHYLSELAKIQVAQQKKELMPVSEIKKTSFQLGRSIRESLANLADRLSNEIAGETDAQAIHKLLTEEHRAALEQLVEAA